ncbi:hypothetical protein KM043_013152 [Ampulex compressa]|nr:hypothetical protein KM043_013152 [Ampulex compressa]
MARLYVSFRLYLFESTRTLCKEHLDFVMKQIVDSRQKASSTYGSWRFPNIEILLAGAGASRPKQHKVGYFRRKKKAPSLAATGVRAGIHRGLISAPNSRAMESLGRNGNWGSNGIEFAKFRGLVLNGIACFLCPTRTVRLG